MKKTVFFCAVILLFSLEHAHAKDYYVSLEGNDSWSGELPEPNDSKTDGPFATLQKTSFAIRTLKKDSGLPVGGITVFIREGTYSFSSTFQLGQYDSGEEGAPITWKAYPGEEVRFSGCKSISGFEPVCDPAVLERLNDTCRDKVLQTSLADQGITQYGSISRSGGNGVELFFRDTKMTLARYPNEGWLLIAQALTSGQFRYSGDYPARWPASSYSDMWMYGYWNWNWTASYQKVKKINTSLKIIYCEYPYDHYGYGTGRRYYFFNILEELDSPGEWYLDRPNGMLYFWPPEPINEGDVLVSTLDETMLYLLQTSYVTFQNIIFEGSRKAAVIIEGGTNNVIDGCTIRNVGGDYSVQILNGTNNGVSNCEISYVASGGIKLEGGDRRTLTPAGNYSFNNHIHHYGRVFSTYYSAVDISGVGNIISHNLIHDSPHLGIWIRGNDHVLEYNEIHDIGLECADVGAINQWTDWTERGNIVRYNYIHHVQSTLTGFDQFNLRMGIYLDAAGSGMKVFGNVFYKVDIGVFSNGGRDNKIENNIFIECKPSVFITGIGLTWARNDIVPGGAWQMYEKLDAVPYKEPPWSTKYPELAAILDDGDPAIPKGNVIERNVSFKGEWLYLYSGLDFSLVSVKKNLIADSLLCVWDIKADYKYTNFFYGDTEMMDLLNNYENTVINDDPGFIDLVQGNFQLRDDSPAWALGFERIPIEKIGLLKDDTPVRVEDKPAELFTLFQNSPNPFNPSTTISFFLPKSGQVKLTVYNMLGQEVMRLADDRFTSGTHSVMFDGGNLASGLYIYRLECGKTVKTRKMLLVK